MTQESSPSQDNTPDHHDQSERAHVGGDMVCVTLQRPPHFWRFACASSGTGDLLERLAELADCPSNTLTWQDAEMIASEIVVHHHLDHPSAADPNDR